MIEVSREDSITFKLINDDDRALDTFKGLMNKLKKEASKKGFKNFLDTEEKIFVTEFTNHIFGNDPTN
jgi:hypothetical protein